MGPAVGALPKITCYIAVPFVRTDDVALVSQEGTECLSAAAALELVRDATRMAHTNIAPATVLGWLQVQLRSVADQPVAR